MYEKAEPPNALSSELERLTVWPARLASGCVLVPNQQRLVAGDGECRFGGDAVVKRQGSADDHVVGVVVGAGRQLHGGALAISEGHNFLAAGVLTVSVVATMVWVDTSLIFRSLERNSHARSVVMPSADLFWMTFWEHAWCLR